jgi:hypothetical protein
MKIQINAAQRLKAAVVLSDADAKKIFKAFLAEDVAKKDITKITYKKGPKKVILRGFGTEGVASDKELKRYNPAWTSEALINYLEENGARAVKASAQVSAGKLNKLEVYEALEKLGIEPGKLIENTPSFMRLAIKPTDHRDVVAKLSSEYGHPKKAGDDLMWQIHDAEFARAGQILVKPDSISVYLS